MLFSEIKQSLINPLPEETSWVVQELINTEDTLNLKITIERGKEVHHISKLTPKYTINNAVLFQMRMDIGLACSPFIFAPQSTNKLTFDTYSLFCNFENVESTSGMTYKADVEFRTFVKNTNKTFYIHDETWRLLVEPTTLNFINYFEITVTISLLDQILRPFALLEKDSKAADLRLKGKDGTVELHSAFLIAYSSVFYSKLCKKAQESSRPYVLAMPDVKQTTLQHLKDYIYLNTIPEYPLSSLTDLLNFASEYKMKELGHMCKQKLATIAVAENFYELTHFALSNDMMELLLDILELIEHGKIKTEDIKKCICTDAARS